MCNRVAGFHLTDFVSSHLAPVPFAARNLFALQAGPPFSRQKKHTHRIRPLIGVRWVQRATARLTNRRLNEVKTAARFTIYHTSYTLCTTL